MDKLRLEYIAETVYDREDGVPILFSVIIGKTIYVSFWWDIDKDGYPVYLLFEVTPDILGDMEQGVMSVRQMVTDDTISRYIVDYRTLNRQRRSLTPCLKCFQQFTNDILEEDLPMEGLFLNSEHDRL